MYIRSIIAHFIIYDNYYRTLYVTGQFAKSKTLPNLQKTVANIRSVKPERFNDTS